MEIADCLLADQAVAFANLDFGVENPVHETYLGECVHTNPENPKLPFHVGICSHQPSIG